jgi:hypothetical protein
MLYDDARSISYYLNSESFEQHVTNLGCMSLTIDLIIIKA